VSPKPLRAPIAYCVPKTHTLFAALNVLDGSVIGRNIAGHGHQEFTRFLKAVDLRHEPPARERQGLEVWPSSVATFANANDG
jgi:hypothetical protein